MVVDIRSDTDGKLKKKLLGKIKLVMDTSKVKAHAFVQTFCKNMEGFTEYEVKEVSLACKIQAVCQILLTETCQIWGVVPLAKKS